MPNDSLAADRLPNDELLFNKFVHFDIGFVGSGGFRNLLKIIKTLKAAHRQGFFNKKSL